MQHVLVVVDDEPAICELMQTALEANGSCRVTPAFSAVEAVAILQRDRPDAAIIDAVLPQVSGLRLAIQALDLGVPVLIATGELATQAKLEAVGCPYLSNPFQSTCLSPKPTRCWTRRSSAAPSLPCCCHASSAGPRRCA